MLIIAELVIEKLQAELGMLRCMRHGQTDPSFALKAHISGVKWTCAATACGMAAGSKTMRSFCSLSNSPLDGVNESLFLWKLRLLVLKKLLERVVL